LVHFPKFGICNQEKSGIPDTDSSHVVVIE
jgi:hypothetical protein